MALASYIPRCLPDPSTATSQPHIVVALHGTLGEPAAFRALAEELAVQGVGLFAPFYGRRGTQLLDVCSAEIAALVMSLPCLLYTSPSPRDGLLSRMPSSA